MVAHAQSELPNECCGLLAGRVGPDGEVAEVETSFALINELKSPTEFRSEARNHLAAEREIRRLGLEVLAVYHSHPSSEPIPSKKDLERNYSERIMNLIIHMQDVRGWWLTETTFVPGQFETV